MMHAVVSFLLVALPVGIIAYWRGYARGAHDACDTVDTYCSVKPKSQRTIWVDLVKTKGKFLPYD